MKINLKAILFFLFLKIGIINACDCAPLKYKELFKYEIENSKHIFLGEVLEIINDTYKIKIIEVFKGEFITKKIIVGKNTTDCSFSINETGMWLIYATLESEMLKVNECGLSRPFKKPYVFPPPPNYNMNEGEKTYFEKQKNILNNEIETLRMSNEKSTGNNG